MKLYKILLLVVILLLLFFTKEKAFYPYQVSVNELYKTDTAFVNQWKLSDGLYNQEEILAAQKLSKDSMGILASDSSHVKIQKIGAFLIARLHSQLGNPKDALFAQSPWQNYNTINARQSEFYCTQYSAMFAFFCRINNLQTREIECKGKNDRHIFDETYLPETKEWVYTDLTQNIILVKNKNRFLSFAEMYEAIFSEKTIADNVAFTVDNNKIAIASLRLFRKALLFNFDSNAVFYYYYVTDLNATKSIADKLKRYVLNQPYFRIYTHQIFFSYWVVVKYFLLGNLFLLLPSLLFAKKRK